MFQVLVKEYKSDMIMSIDELIEFITESDSKEYAIIGNGGGGKSFLANKLKLETSKTRLNP